jgi:hypothetical protein
LAMRQLFVSTVTKSKLLGGARRSLWMKAPRARREQASAGHPEGAGRDIRLLN